MKRSLTVAVFAMALGSAAQTAPPPTTMAVRITEARKANAGLMRQYSWTSRTEVIDQGQVKDLRLEASPTGRAGSSSAPS